jgi:hypothetical protein
MSNPFYDALDRLEEITKAPGGQAECMRLTWQELESHLGTCPQPQIHLSVPDDCGQQTLSFEWNFHDIYASIYVLTTGQRSWFWRDHLTDRTVAVQPNYEPLDFDFLQVLETAIAAQRANGKE